jgi:hypothetical protein
VDDVIELSEESNDVEDAVSSSDQEILKPATQSPSPWFTKGSPKKSGTRSLPPTLAPVEPAPASKSTTFGGAKGAKALDSRVGAPKQSALVLADKMRPNTLEDFVGHGELVEDGALLRTLIDNDTIPSMILWAPPGTGKTTLANIIAHRTKCRFVKLSAVTSGMPRAYIILI